MKAKSFVLSLLLAGSAFLYGCNAETNNDETKKANDALMIYTTVYPLQDFASKIGGEYVNVQSVYPPGVEAHTFEPTTKTMKELADADAFIYIGEGMEGFVDQAIKTLKNEDVKLVEGAKGIELLDSTHEHHDEGEEEHDHDHSADAHEHEGTHEDEHHHGDKDPHVWLDPVLSITIAENIKNALAELKPEAKETFEKNFTALKKDLEELDQQFQTIVKEAPKKEILVSHAAYGYWEERYGIEQISVAGLSPTNEPSQKELANIIKTAKQHDIKYILFEQNVTPKVAEVVKNEIGAEALHLHNLESLTDEDVQKNKDYITIMKENLEVLKKALN
jgi:zinc transport system substrate-binding protein